MSGILETAYYMGEKPEYMVDQYKNCFTENTRVLGFTDDETLETCLARLHDSGTDEQSEAAYRNLLSLIDNAVAKEFNDRKDDIGLFEAMLKKAKVYGTYASKFCVLEAKLYIRMAEIIDTENFRAGPLREHPREDVIFKDISLADRNIIRWLQKKTHEERNDILVNAARGFRIAQMRSLETKVENLKKRMAFSDSVARAAVEEYFDSGSVVISEEFALGEGYTNKTLTRGEIQQAYERTRKALMRSGAVGLGDGTTTYVNPKACNDEQIVKAIRCRVMSIVSDIEALVKLVNDRGLNNSSLLSDVGNLRNTVNKLDALLTIRCEAVA